MDWLKRLIADIAPNSVPADAEHDPNFKPIRQEDLQPKAPLDLSTPENTGIRNLLATINQDRDPNTLQLDPRRMADNQSFQGMNEQPMGLAPMIKAMPDQLVPKPEAPMSTIGEAPVIKSASKVGTKKPSINDTTTPESKKEEASIQEPDVLQKLGLGDIKPPDDKEMAAAQEARGNNMLAFNLNKAFNQIGSGIGQTKADPTYGDFLKDAVDMPVSNLKEKRASEKELENRERDRQKFIMDKADFKSKQEMSAIDLEKAKMGLSDEKQRNDPASDASRLARQSTRDSLLRMGRKDLAAGVKDTMSAEQLNKLFGSNNLSNMLTQYEAQQSRLEIDKQRAEDAKIRQAEKMDAKDTQRMDQASKLIAADLARNNTAFGRNANIVRSADAILTLAGNTPPDKMTPQQIMEIAKNLDSMLSSGAATVTGTQKLMPAGWGSKAATIQEFLTNNPQAARQGGYIRMALETVKREKELAHQKINTTSNALLGSYLDLAKKHPESWAAMLKGHGLDPSAIGGEQKPQEQEQGHGLNIDQNALDAEIAARKGK